MSGRCAERFGSAGFSSKPRTRQFASVSMTPKRPAASAGVDFDGGHGDVGAGIHVLLQHLAVIHLVDVVAGKDDGVVGALAADGIDVLIDGVGGAQVPAGGDAHLRRQDFDEVAQAHQRRPALADVAVQAERLVLREDEDAAQVAVDAIGKRDVDDAVDAAERERRAWRGRGSAAKAARPGRRPEGYRWRRPLNEITRLRSGIEAAAVYSSGMNPCCRNRNLGEVSPAPASCPRRAAHYRLY